MLTFIKDLGMRLPRAESKQPKRYGLYVCHCGKECEAPTYKVESGNQISCGCYKNSMLGIKTKKHGETNTELYKRWVGMKTRCYTPKSSSYDRFGAIGVIVCDEWKNSYENFRSWAFLNGYKKGLSLDRINPYGNYEPTNCRWIPLEMQMQNIRHKEGYTSKYKGVHMMKNGKFRAKISGKHIGCFDNEEDAAKAYNDYAIKNKTYHSLNVITKE